jgi:hypothetical protein
MANLNFAFSSAPLRTIQEVQFGLLNPEEIKGMSVCQILYPETMVSIFSLRKFQPQNTSDIPPSG